MLPVLPDHEFFLWRIALSAVLAGLLLWQLQRRLASPARWPFAVAPGILPFLLSLALFIPLFFGIADLLHWLDSVYMALARAVNR